MKAFLTIAALVCFKAGVVAQSKVTPASQSEFCGINLPAGSKKDKRLLVEATAKVVLQMTADDNNIKLQEDIEVLILPAGKATEEQIKRSIQNAGWQMNTVANQSSNWVLSKADRSVLIYLAASKNDTQFYLSNIIPAPPIVNTVSVNQTPVNTEPLPARTPNPPPPTINAPATDDGTRKTVNQMIKPAAPITNFKFNTTNFDDGWIGVERENWVEVTKGNVKVLIHYPTKATSEYISDPNLARETAWNTLVAPRYSNLQNYFVAKNSLTYIEASFMSGTMTDNATGNIFYVALFHRDKSPWMEFIAPSINDFGLITGFDISKLNDYVSSDAWPPLQKMEGYNKFAVAESDFTGTWTNNFSGFQQYVNAYTGADAGAATHSSSEVFEFGNNNTYSWSLGVASGFVGSIKFANAKGSGKFTIPNNWQIHFSEMEGKPKLYNAYFSCIKGARILWLQDTSYGGYSGFGKK